MHLVTFLEGDQCNVGVLNTDRDAIYDLAKLAPALPRNMLALIEEGDAALQCVRDALLSSNEAIPLSSVQLLAPIPEPRRNLFCVGKNYQAHVREVQSSGLTSNQDQPAAPDSVIIFTKATTSVIGPGQAIPATLDPTASADYEGELAVVIGRGGRGISREQAMQHVYGYTIVNDVTSRRLQKQHQQWFLGKSLDGFCPMGPSLVTADEINDVTKLGIQTRVNGELRQDGCVVDLIFDIPELIETLSRGMTLLPGDIIATGTPAGVGMGFKPPRFLKPEDVVSIHIDPIGTLENPVT